MADKLTRTERSLVMAAVRGRGNRSTELRLRDLFRKLRITGWRRGYPLPGHPDFVFPKLRMVVFVDGCFWHGCPKHGRRPKSRCEYWNAKIDTNISRDRSVTSRLRLKGWRVIRIWEHELRPTAELRLSRRLLRIDWLRGE
jgi:DNA mismatch endonuclease (patch repair protein)